MNQYNAMTVRNTAFARFTMDDEICVRGRTSWSIMTQKMSLVKYSM